MPNARFEKAIILIKKTAGFISKYRILLTIAASMLILLILLYNLVPVIPISNSKLIDLNAETRLEPNQTLILKDFSTSLAIDHFTNDTCPVPGACYGTTDEVHAVEYRLIINGQKYATGSSEGKLNAKYKVITISSDYQTYATVKIVNK